MLKLILLLFFLIPMNVKATSTIAMDMNTHKIFYANNINEQRPVASISKIMTAIIACESGKLDDNVIVGEEINDSYGSGVYIKVGEQLTLRDLVYGLMLRSGNDASFAIAKYVGGTVEDFIEIMNKKAIEIGMTSSKFNNPNGLDDKGGNISTAYDMALLTSYAMKNIDYKTITSTKKYFLRTNMNTYIWTNKNKLLFSYKYTTGGKTGYTDVAKRTLVTTASNNNLDVAVVTLNDGNDFNDHKQLYEQVFKDYKGYYLLKSGTVDIINENFYNQSFYIKNDFIYPLKEIERDNLLLKYELIKKSYNDNDEVGEVKIFLNNKMVGTEKIYIKTNDKVTLWQKIKSLFVKE